MTALAIVKRTTDESRAVVDAQPAPPPRAEVRAEIIQFYEVHNPAKVAEVDKLLDMAGPGNEASLLERIKQKTAYEIGVRLVGSEMCIRDRSCA